MAREEVSAEECVREEEVGLVVGVRNAGKSTVAKRLIRTHCDAGGSAVVWDLHDEMSREGRQTRQVRLGALERRVTVQEFLGDPDLLWQERVSLAVVPTAWKPSEVAEEFCAWLDAALAAVRLRDAGSPLLVWVTEAGVLAGVREAEQGLEYCATQGRHVGEGFGFGADVQACAMFPAKARRQVTKAWWLAQYNALDLDAVDDVVGVTAPELRREVPLLKQHEYRFWMAPMAAHRGKEKKT